MVNVGGREGVGWEGNNYLISVFPLCHCLPPSFPPSWLGFRSPGAGERISGIYFVSAVNTHYSSYKIQLAITNEGDQSYSAVMKTLSFAFVTMVHCCFTVCPSVCVLWRPSVFLRLGWELTGIRGWLCSLRQMKGIQTCYTNYEEWCWSSKQRHFRSRQRRVCFHQAPRTKLLLLGFAFRGNSQNSDITAALCLKSETGFRFCQWEVGHILHCQTKKKTSPSKERVTHSNIWSDHL